MVMRRLPVHIWIRPENADPATISGYFLEIARRLDECPRRMRLIVESSVSVSLDFDPKDGNPVISVDGALRKFDIRHRWLAEHPVPLNFGARPVVLLIDPIDGNRFRVYSMRRTCLPRWIYALLSASATVAVLTFHPVAIAAALIAAAALILNKCLAK
jgi:hypothetical protein